MGRARWILGIVGVGFLTYAWAGQLTSAEVGAAYGGRHPPEAKSEAAALGVSLEGGWCRYPTRPRKRPVVGALRGVGEVEPNDTPATAQDIPLGDGPGQDRDLDITGSISPATDVDYYRFSAVKGDVIGMACLAQGALDPVLRVAQTDDTLVIENEDDWGFTGAYPAGSPLPAGAVTSDSALSWVVPDDGDYLIRVWSSGSSSTGSYTLQIRSRRPYMESQVVGSTQIVFLDFNAATINAQQLFGGGSTSATLSPLSSFLGGWGLQAADESAVVDAIIAVVEENFDDLRIAGLNGDRDTDLIDGHFDVEFRNSRDDPDPFGQANVSRVIIGGTIAQLGISTIGIAESIDPGNFGVEETAVVLLDLLSAPAPNPNSINSISRDPGFTMIDAIGRIVGNIVAHEAGHYLGNWHTHSANAVRCLMDQGGFLPENVGGVGPDGILGTADDDDVDFVLDGYTPGDPNQPVAFGNERTDVRTAFALATGAASDCNNNGVPDEDDIASGTSQDSNANGVPDECETPSLSNGTVEPPSGTDLTNFTFEVTYTDPTGQEPVLRRLEIKRSGASWCSPSELCQDFDPNPVEGTLETGAVFRLVRQLAEGSYYHRFHFQAGDGTHLYWPDTNGTPGPTVDLPDQLQVTFWSVPSGVDAYQPGDVPSFYWEVREPASAGGELVDAELIQVFTTPPGGQNLWVTAVRVSTGRYEYNTPAVPADNWQFGCACYTFLTNATHPDYASGQAALEFYTCPPCPPECPPVSVDTLTVSPHTITPGGGPIQIDHCISLDARETIWIKAPNGQVARTLLDGVDRSQGCWTDTWDGLDDSGQPLPVGNYTVEIEALHLDPSHPMLRFGPTGAGTGEVLAVRGLAYYGNEVYVFAHNYSWDPKIVTYDSDGTFLREWFLPRGQGPSEASWVVGMAGDPEGRLYVMDDQPQPRITVWDAVTENWICELGRGQMDWPQCGTLGPIAYDAFSHRVLTWQQDLSVPDTKVYAFQAPCGPLDCEIDPTPEEVTCVPGSGLAAGADGNVWASTLGGLYLFEPCGPVIRQCWGPVTPRISISIRYGRLLYAITPGLVQVYDLRCNWLQQFCIESQYDDTRFIVTPEGAYIYARGDPCPSSDEFQCVRIQDCNSATVRTELVRIVPGIISVTTPNGGECWLRDTLHPVAWATQGTVDYVTIRLYDGPDEVIGLSPLAENIPNGPNGGANDWLVPADLPAGASYRIRVEDSVDPSTIYDWSDAPFGVSESICDFDCDGDVDLDDFAQFVACYNGAARPAAPACPPGVDADFDDDGDVDLDDFAIFAANYTGAQ